jgi:hypothetical protein
MSKGMDKKKEDKKKPAKTLKKRIGANLPSFKILKSRPPALHLPFISGANGVFLAHRI